MDADLAGAQGTSIQSETASMFQQFVRDQYSLHSVHTTQMEELLAKQVADLRAVLQEAPRRQSQESEVAPTLEFVSARDAIVAARDASEWSKATHSTEPGAVAGDCLTAPEPPELGKTATEQTNQSRTSHYDAQGYRKLRKSEVKSVFKGVKSQTESFADAFVQRRQSNNNKVNMRWLRFVIEDKVFVSAVTILILVNAGVAGFITNMEVRDTFKTFDLRVAGQTAEYAGTPSWYLWLDTAFAVIFTMELGMRIAALDYQFLLGKDSSWNMFDLTIVLCSWLELVTAASNLNVSYGRALRIFRILRAVRALRLVRFAEYFRFLRLTLLSIMSSLGPLMWTAILLTAILYTFCLLFVQGVVEYVKEASASDPASQTTVNSMKEWFESVHMCLCTLFMCVTGGVNYWSVLQLLEELGTFYFLVFLAFIMIVLLGMLNIVTGIFVNDAMNVASMDQEMIVSAAREKTREMVTMLKRLFTDADADESRALSLEEVKVLLHNDDFRSKLNAIGLHLDHKKVRDIFEDFDVDIDGTLAIDEWVVGCLKLIERSTDEDFFTLHKKLRSINDAMPLLRSQLEAIQGDLTLLRSRSLSVVDRAQGGQVMTQDPADTDLETRPPDAADPVAEEAWGESPSDSISTDIASPESRPLPSLSIPCGLPEGGDAAGLPGAPVKAWFQI